jgi:hypothetical protein
MLYELEGYDEVVEFIDYGNGMHVLLPSELDLAIMRASIAERQQALEDFEAETMPAEIRSCVERVSRWVEQLGGADLPEGVSRELFERQLEKIEDWENARILDRRRREQELRGLRRTLARAEQEEPDEEGARVQLTFPMRLFSFEEKMVFEDRHTAIDEHFNRTVDFHRRNLELLNAVMQGNLVDGKVQELKGRAEKVLPDIVVTTLIERMWTRNRMPLGLRDYFRAGRQTAGRARAA